jgi:hypothetical protein
MSKALIIIGALLLVLGGAATFQSADGSLRFFPAAFLPLNRPFIAGPDLPAYLTSSGIALVYLVPGAILIILGGVVLYRTNSHSTSSTTAPNER